MKRIFQLSAIILVYLVTCGKSCNEAKSDEAALEMAREHKAHDSIASVFSSDSLSQASLKAFENTAKYKLSDLSDYFKIISDTTADQAFKSKTCELIGGLFIPDAHIELPLSLLRGRKGCDLETFLGIINKNRAGIAPLTFDSVRVKQALHQESDTLCSGKLAFCLHGKQIEGREIPGKCDEREVDIYVCKHSKIFGKDTLRIWKVYLGDIR
ncbi:MAG: hypothetical protein WCO44_02100 [Bacteroidota bacterium]